jgi:hypothetical protein
VDVEALHRAANRAIKTGRLDEAMQCYDIATRHSACCSRTFMLKALLQRRLGAVDGARAAFEAGAARLMIRDPAGAAGASQPTLDLDAWPRASRKEDAQLLQAWGLFESKHGDLQFAYNLLKAAVCLDRNLAGVLRWRMFRGVSN